MTATTTTITYSKSTKDDTKKASSELNLNKYNPEQIICYLKEHKIRHNPIQSPKYMLI